MLKNYKFLLAAQIMVLAASAPIFAMDAEGMEQEGGAKEFLGIDIAPGSGDESEGDRENRDEQDGLGLRLSRLVDDQAGSAIPVVPAISAAPAIPVASAEPQVAREVAQDGEAAPHQAGEERGERCAGCGGFHGPRGQFARMPMKMDLAMVFTLMALGELLDGTAVAQDEDGGQAQAFQASAALDPMAVLLVRQLGGLDRAVERRQAAQPQLAQGQADGGATQAPVAGDYLYPNQLDRGFGRRQPAVAPEAEELAEPAVLEEQQQEQESGSDV